ncbi:hypothetical protein GQ457_17G009990 [Hibiscus cannabinus]
MAEELSLEKNKMTKQVTSKKDDTPLHSAVNFELVLEIISGSREDVESEDLLSKQNKSGETALYVAAECGYADLVKEMIKYHDIVLAGVKARNGFDAFHIAAKQGDLEVLKILMDSNLDLSMTFDSYNTSALHTAASQGHTEVVNFLLEKGSNVAAIARSKGKTALHSAARNGHLEIVKTLLWNCNKRHNVEVGDVLIKSDPSLINMVDAKGNTALHIGTRKGRIQIVEKLLNVHKLVINKSGETALDAAETNKLSVIACILKEHGVQCAKSIKPHPANSARELKQTVSIMLSTPAQWLLFLLPLLHLLPFSMSQANMLTVRATYNQGCPLDKRELPKTAIYDFIIFDSIALFISLAVVVVQTSVVVIERRAKKQMMAVINKLMRLACVLISVSFLALSYVVVGKDERLLANLITGIGTIIMVSTLGTLCYWVIMNRIEASKIRSIRRSSMTSRSQSLPTPYTSGKEILNNEHKKLFISHI